MLHMLDTNIVSYIIKGHSKKIEQKLSLLPSEMICISVMTRAELLYGLKKLAEASQIHMAVHQLLKIIRALPWDSDAANYYADIRHQLTANGQGIGEMDMMIAAHSLSAGAVLVTNNLRHFERIQPPLMLENWT
jgi:tRNA(fMet)-specific endonuclease VapC